MSGIIYRVRIQKVLVDYTVWNIPVHIPQEDVHTRLEPKERNKRVIPVTFSSIRLPRYKSPEGCGHTNYGQDQRKGIHLTRPIEFRRATDIEIL
jgi:hypothetical protein